MHKIKSNVIMNSLKLKFEKLTRSYNLASHKRFNHSCKQRGLDKNKI